MRQIIIGNPDKLAAIIRFARSAGCEQRLGLDLLALIETLTAGTTPEDNREARVWPDFAPYSMAWCIWNGEPAREHVILVGGWIYDGPGSPSDGTFPSLTVNLDRLSGQAVPTHRWLIHT